MKAEETADYHIKTAWHSISRMYNNFSVQHDMTMAIGYVLLNIHKNGTPATKIAPALGLEPRSLTRILKTLEEKRWIKKTTDKTDKRIVNVFLTEKGKEKRDLAKTGVIEFNQLIIEKIGQEKLDKLIEIMSEINQTVDSITLGQ